MQVGVVPVLSNRQSGIFQYSYNLLTALYNLETRHRIIVFADDHSPLGFLGDPREGWQTRALEPFTVRRWLRKYLRRMFGKGPAQAMWENSPPPKTFNKLGEEEEEVLDPDVIQYKPERGRWFARAGADAMLYPAPSILSFEAGIPFIVALHDLKFKLYQEFPQLLNPGGSEMYEYMIRNTLRYAALILADSEAARDDILNYGDGTIGGNAIKVVPLLPPAYMGAGADEEEVQAVLQKYGLNDPYLFYPAVFLPHKNHDRLVEAVHYARMEFKLPVHVVFCGDATGAIRKERCQEILDLVHDRDLDARVRYLGFVPESDMAALYAGARVVADLTLFGSSSFVVQEAWAAGRPVVASRIRGIREQVGDAGILVDPRNIEEIAEGIRKLWTGPATRSEFSDRGRSRQNAFSLADLSRFLGETFDQLEEKLESDEES